ncbi:MAG: hypothetical protein CSA33_02235 [Desulfobulbus propionicus]|nr:MAG: hypothetical protein CSA33_02235 [Desulfobulbus propionicus]
MALSAHTSPQAAPIHPQWLEPGFLISSSRARSGSFGNPFYLGLYAAKKLPKRGPTELSVGAHLGIIGYKSFLL